MPIGSIFRNSAYILNQKDQFSKDAQGIVRAQLNAAVTDLLGGGENPALKAVVAKIDLNPAVLGDETLRDLVTAKVIPALSNRKEFASVVADFFGKDEGGEQRVREVLHLDKAAIDNPLLKDRVNLEKGRAFGKILTIDALDDQKLTTLFTLPGTERVGLVNTWSNEGLITPEQKENLSNKLVLADLAQDQFDLVENLVNKNFNSSLDMVRLSKDDLKDLIENGAELPGGMSKDVYADNILGRVEQMHRSAHFMHRALKAPEWVPEDYRFEVPDDMKSLFTGFMNANPGLDLMTANLLPVFGDKPLNDPENINPALLKKLIEIQQTLKITPDTASALAMLKHGYSTAKTATISPDRLASETGLSPEVADCVQQKAVMEQYKASNLWVNMMLSNDVYSKTMAGYDKAGLLLKEKVASVLPMIKDVNDLAPAVTLEALFGSGDYCECDDCQSVLSPAAYFVDLMRFVQNHIWNTPLGKLEETDRLHLKTRRPDLWNLELSCENTNERIPYLDIVVEVMDAFLQKHGVISGTQAVSIEPAGLEFTLPYSKSLDEIRTYLPFWGLTRYELLEFLYPSPNDDQKQVLALEKLNLSHEQYKIIIDQNNSGSGDLIAGENDVLNFIRLSGYNSDEVEQLVGMHFWNGRLSIKQEVISAENQYFKLYFEAKGSLKENDKSNLYKNFHRIIRLQKASGYSLKELDVLLHALNITYDSLNASAILKIADAKRIQEIMQLDVDTLACMINTDNGIPGSDMTAVNGKNTIWHKKQLVRLNRKTIPITSESDIEDDIQELLILLQHFLGITLDEFYTLAQSIKPFLSVDKGKVLLSERKLSTLFRYAKIAKWSGASFVDFFEFLKPQKSGEEIKTPEAIVHLLRNIEAIKQLGLTIEEWNFLTSPVSTKLDPPSEDEVDLINSSFKKFAEKKPYRFSADALLNLDFKDKEGTDRTTTQKLEWIDGIFKFLTEQRAEIWDETTVPLMHKVEKGIYQLGKSLGFPPDFKITGFSIDTPEILNRLLEFHPHLMFFSELLNADKAFILHADCFLRPDDSYRSANILYENSSLKKADDRNLLIEVKRILERVLLLYKKFKIDTSLAKDIRQSGADMFNYQVANGLTDKTVKSLKLTAQYAESLSSLFPNRPVSFVLMLESLGDKSITTEEQKILKKWLKTEGNILNEGLKDPDTAINSVLDFEDFIKRINYCQQLRIGWKNLKVFGEANNAKHLLAANWVKMAFRARFEDDEQLKKEEAPYRNAVNNRFRDALCNYLIYRRGAGDTNYGFDSRSQLYQYFLLDVEMGDCFTTSRVVAATNSIQLYIHRCLMGLERSKSNPLQVIALDKTGVQQWEWRKNYRVWEANRKVFLFPENYMEPELRDNRTPQFKELEDELLQQKLSLDVVEAAYRKYLTQFMELAQLRIAGSYYDVVSKKYFLFARNDHGTYYMRDVFINPNNPNEVDWGNWEKIECQIPAREVSSIIHNSKLYIFWLSYFRKDISKLYAGNYYIYAYTFDMFVNYTYKNISGKWNPPQKALYHSFSTTDQAPFTKIENNKTEKSIWDSKRIDDFAISKRREHVLQRFERLVFRKPYLKSVGIGDSIEVKTILTHEVGVPFEDTITGYNCEVTPVRFTLNYQIEMDSFGFLKDNEELYKINIEYLKSFHVSFQSNPKQLGFETPSNIPLIPLPLDTHFPLEFKKDDLLWANTDSFRFYYKIAINNNNNYTIIFDKYILLNDQPVSVMYYDGQKIAIKIVNLSDILKIKVNNDAGILGKGKCSTFPIYTRKSTEGTPELTQGFLRLSDASINGLNLKPGAIEDTDPFKLEFDKSYFAEFAVDSGHYIQGNANYLTSNEININGASSEMKTANNTMQLFPGKHDEMWKKFNEGLLHFLSPLSQYSVEPQIDYNKSFGNYFYELFFHIPFLLANHLNTSGRYKEANFWYNQIFNPTAINNENLVDPAFVYWRFVAFRKNLNQPLSEMFKMGSMAMKKYEEDPFNPHAIARFRDNAYPKNVIMKYLDNLLDWADSLYRQYQMESINEAIMLYTLAKDILGERPLSKGKCKKGGAVTYQQILDSKDQGDFIQMVVAGTSHSKGVANDYTQLTATYHPDQKQICSPSATKKPLPEPLQPELAFCFPNNEMFLQYWDRVDNRLFNIRNCRDIDGIKREVSLFSLTIDPAMLVRAAAQGLSITDILDNLNSQLPPYRFTYIIEKAKQFCGTVQSLGGALLSALEKKDAEELTLIRSINEQNILALTENIKKQQIEEAKTNLENLRETQKNIQNRVNHYSKLIDTGLIPWERTQQISKHSATGLRLSESVFSIVAGFLKNIPQVGAPTAMTFGGVQLEGLAKGGLNSAKALGDMFENIGNLAGLEASNQRREEDWKFQLKLAEQELKAFEKQILSAEMRLAIAEADLKNHKISIEQTKKLDDFYKDKFSNFGLYTYHANTLLRLYRMAFNMAEDMARKAERVYQFECNEIESVITGDNWTDQYGLLTGEKLLLQLQQLEKKWIEKNKRTPEITQSFSMMQIDPMKLLKLKMNGECSGFEIPEAAFDLVYPGYYKRIIKSVRITIPCIVGPYTNVGLTLKLTGNKVRPSAFEREESSYKEYSNKELFISRQVQEFNLATSTAQNDGGQFELNFRDERFLPFEGAGAISTWTLKLPSQKKFRPFDYNTISDVIFHISYTAEYSDAGPVEAVLGEALNKLNGEDLTRLFSLRHDFPNEWHAWAKQNQPLSINLEKHYFPYFVQMSDVTITKVAVYKKDNDTPVVGSLKLTQNTDNKDWTLTDDYDEKPILDPTNENYFLIVHYTI